MAIQMTILTAAVLRTILEMAPIPQKILRMISLPGFPKMKIAVSQEIPGTIMMLSQEIPGMTMMSFQEISETIMMLS